MFSFFFFEHYVLKRNEKHNRISDTTCNYNIKYNIVRYQLISFCVKRISMSHIESSFHKYHYLIEFNRLIQCYLK